MSDTSSEPGRIRFQLRLWHFLLLPVFCIYPLLWLSLPPNSYGPGTRMVTLAINVRDAESQSPVVGAFVWHMGESPLPIVGFSTDSAGRTTYTNRWSYYQDTGWRKRIRGRISIDYFGSLRVTHPDYESISPAMSSLTSDPAFHGPNPPAITLTLRRKTKGP